jgi:hypothetical protein
MIDVKQIADGDPMLFSVAVTDGATTRHEVTMSAGDCLSQGHAPEQVIEAAFRFLLDREEGVDPRPVRCEGDCHLFPGVRAEAAGVPLVIAGGPAEP